MNLTLSDYSRLYYRSEIASLVDFYVQAFIGREEDLAHIASFARQEEPGYLLVEALPGYGKSALAVQLAHRRETGRWGQSPVPELLYFFIRQEGQRNTPVAFLQAINSQLLEMLRLPGGVPVDVNALRSQFSQLWACALEATCDEKPLLLLVDGLDEMSMGQVTIAHVLPASLASYVRIVVTSRPNPGPLQQVDLTHPFRKAGVLRLHTFNESEIRSLLQEYGVAKIAAADLAPSVLAMTKGEPLFARFVCQDVGREGAVALVRLEQNPPPDVEAYFRQQFRHLDTLAESDQTWDILGLLVMAQGGMTVEEISEALGLGKRKTRRAVEPIMRFLLGESRLELMHLQLRNVVSAEFSNSRQEEYHQKLLSWCQSYQARGWPAQTPDYILLNYARHLIEADRVDDLYALVESRDWTRAKHVDTPWVDSLVQDLQLASNIDVGQGIEGWPRSMAYQLRRALLEDLMSRPSDKVTVFMAELGRVDQALHFARRHPWRSFQLYHEIAEVVAVSQPDKALEILLQSVHLFDNGSILNQYGARLVVAKKILENDHILVKVPSAAQEAENLAEQAERIEPYVPQSDRLSYQAMYTCSILALTGQLDEAKALAKSLPLPSSSQALRHISLLLPSEHPEKAPMAEDALSILESAERNAETVTREVQAIVTLFPYANNRRQAQFIERLVSLERELHTVSDTSHNPSWLWVVESIAEFDLDETRNILSSAKLTSGWTSAWPALIGKIALRDPEEALSTAENQYSQHAGYSSVLIDVIRTVAIQFDNIEWAKELIEKYSKPLSGPFGRISKAHLAIAEAYLAQGNAQKAEEVFDEQVFIISDQGVKRGRNDLLIAMLDRFSALDLHDVEVISKRLESVGEGLHFSPQRLLGYLAARQGKVDFIETYRLGAKAQISAIGEVANCDIQLAKTLWDKWNFNWPADRQEERSNLDVYIEAREAKEDPSKIEELLECYDGKESPHDMCNKMMALPNALHLLLEQGEIDPDEAKTIVERTYPILVNWKCQRGKSDCRCYSRSERTLALLISIMAKLDYERAKSMTESLPLRPVKVAALKSILLNAQFDEDLLKEIVKLSREVLAEPLDLARSYYDLAANVLPADKKDWITRAVELADPLVDDNAWPPPSSRLKTMQAKAWMRLLNHPGEFDYVERAIASIGSFRDKLEFLDVLAERVKEWPREQRHALLRRVWELATTRRVDDVEALIAFSIPILESLEDDKETVFWGFYDYVEWAYQGLPELDIGQGGG